MLTNTRTMLVAASAALVALSQGISLVSAQGTGVIRRPEMDRCRGAFGPVPTDGRVVPGSFAGMNPDPIAHVNEGFCGVDIGESNANTMQNATTAYPGIWYKVIGTGNRVRASTCDERTKVLVTISAFTLGPNPVDPKNKTCDENNLRCIGGSASGDFECRTADASSGTGGWETMSTAYDFDTIKDHVYYVFVQNIDPKFPDGSIWISFREPKIPQNDHCVDAIGPIPRDGTRILATSVDATKDAVSPGVCGKFQSLYPGVWFQLMGTGGIVTVSACSEFNLKGFQLSVYKGATCYNMKCVKGGKFSLKSSAPDKCTFGPGQIERPLSTYALNTTDRSRYYVMVHYNEVSVAPTTSAFRFYVEDGQSGKAGSGGSSSIVFRTGGGLLGPTESDAEIEEKEQKNQEQEERRKKQSSGVIDVHRFWKSALVATLLVASTVL